MIFEACLLVLWGLDCAGLFSEAFKLDCWDVGVGKDISYVKKDRLNKNKWE
jgi:hypothetical protein